MAQGEMQEKENEGSGPMLSINVMCLCFIMFFQRMVAVDSHMLVPHEELED
jgi:hypothetical protein